MAYDKTRVPVADSQSAIRQIVYSHKGTGISFTSRPPKEGFEALVTMQDQAYHIRVMATCKEKSDRASEERRVWRVLSGCSLNLATRRSDRLRPLAGAGYWKAENSLLAY